MTNTRYSRQILMKLDHSGQILKNTPTPNFMRIRSARAQLFHADRWTNRRIDRHNEAKSRFS
jgi:hypothetical protein